MWSVSSAYARTSPSAWRQKTIAWEAAALLSAVVEGAADVIFLKDLEGRYLFINEAGARLCRRSKAAVVGKADEELFPRNWIDTFRLGDHEVMTTGTVHSYRRQSPLTEAARRFRPRKARIGTAAAL